MNMKKSKQWIAIFFTLVFAGILLFMAVNFIVDPTGYFSVERGTAEVDANGYTRAAKSKYIKKNADQYNAVVLGGSKAGVLSTQRLSEYSGKNYYNFYIAYGCFADFLTYTRYLIDTAEIEEITLHLSSIEVQKYSRADVNEIYEVPAVVDGSFPELILENLNYLCRNITSSIDYLREGNTELTRGMDLLENGERNYSYSYGLMEEDLEGYVKKYVLPRFKSSLKSLFDGKDPSMPAIEDSLAAMREIKALCDERGVVLNVVIGPSFLVERAKFESQPYYDYLRELVAITDVWDFSSLGGVNLNPYNFVNEGHYKTEVGDLMIDTMYGKNQKDGFGILLTEENIEGYLEQREAEYELLKAEYEATGTIALPGMEDESYVGG